jgi:hypothetical protein
MIEETDRKLDRLLEGKPELANTLEKVKTEGTRRAVEAQTAHIVCMDKQGALCIRTAGDHQDEKRKLTALVYCFANGKRSNIKQKG